MRFVVRAAGIAATFLFATVGTFGAAPSKAWELVPSPLPETGHSYAATYTSQILPDDKAAPTDIAPAAEPAVVQQQQPALEPKRSLAELVEDFSSSDVSDSEHECLAGAVYFESKGEPLKGQLSVAEVIRNRASSGRFPSTYCGVVKQRGQFSFVHGGRLPAIPRSSPAWRKAVAVARIAMNDLADGGAPRAMFFHATYVSPKWRGRTRVATVGNHIFYR
jgi:N-acetylmuramoyl-L-alanine amidase